jgi:glutamine synthetase
MCTEQSSFSKLVKNNDIKFVDFRFTDTKGKWQHTTYDVDNVDNKLLSQGIPFDGSSIAGWQNINKSDMLLSPDLSTAKIDPFTPYPTLIVTCNINDPDTNHGYELDPRHTASLAEKYLVDTKIGTEAFFGSELEFFIFDDVRFNNSNYNSSYAIDSNEHPMNSNKNIETGNLGHRPKNKGGYFPVPPVDSAFDIRAEMFTIMKEMGLEPILHHHEVAPAQHEIGFKFNTLVNNSDAIQQYKYIVHNIANSYGKTATFMPKPVFNDNGSGMHTHQSIWNKGQNIFAGTSYAGLSETALYYIGGIIRHAKALNAFTNASTNSYKRLVPGFEAPTILAYSSRNRSAAIRIPHSNGHNAKRIEVRFPDPTANPYLSSSAMLLAGIDGILNKIHPGEADERDLYNLSEQELKSKPQVARSLAVALDNLDSDRKFLTTSGVLTDNQIDVYLNLKHQELDDLNQRPHPIEFENYYSC